jgi:hypothetical protein
MPWSWSNIDWTPTGTLAALAISSLSLVLTWAAPLRTARIARAENARASEDKLTKADRVRFDAIRQAALQLRAIVPTINGFAPPHHLGIRLTASDVTSIKATIAEIGAYARPTDPVSPTTLKAVMKAEQILSRFVNVSDVVVYDGTKKTAWIGQFIDAADQLDALVAG